MTQKKLQHRVEEEEEDNSAYGFYKRLERQSRVMKSNLTDNVRAILVDWLTEVHASLGYGPETLFLAVNVVDRFVSLSLEVLSMAELKLLSMAALVIACKYGEEWFPAAIEFNKIPETYFTRSFHGISYSQDEINSMEIKILKKLDWKLMVPTIHTFLLELFSSCGVGETDGEFKNLAFCFGEIAMNDYDMIVRYSASSIAASAVCAAQCCMCKRHGWNRALETGYSKRQVVSRAGRLLRLLKMKPDRKVFKKYSNL
ncbi:G2/mitotic-specific cyclin-1-like [Corylus avellana]|uniref:G2/mitotic-specific cyclin-1-like n=1 Tax=Corylus avellana TaxID=13451 RepID=UPI00286CBB69|nr:G2/mitotic-specific cyclin-1-like [Corylus avellana]